MSRKQATVQVARHPIKQTIIPEPPSDLWEQMDKLHVRIGMRQIVKMAPGDFTTGTYSEHYVISRTRAGDRIKKMMTEGHVESVGINEGQEVVYRFKK